MIKINIKTHSLSLWAFWIGMLQSHALRQLFELKSIYKEYAIPLTTQTPPFCLRIRSISQ